MHKGKRDNATGHVRRLWCPTDRGPVRLAIKVRNRSDSQSTESHEIENTGDVNDIQLHRLSDIPAFNSDVDIILLVLN